MVRKRKVPRPMFKWEGTIEGTRKVSLLGYS